MDGTAAIERTWIDRNEADFGGGVFFGGVAGGSISQSTVSHSIGGGFHSHSDTNMEIINSTFSANHGGRGAIYNGKRDGLDRPNGPSDNAAISGDGRFVAFESDAFNLVHGDTNHRLTYSCTTVKPVSPNASVWPATVARRTKKVTSRRSVPTAATWCSSPLRPIW